MLKGLQGKTGDIILGFYPQFPENHITLSLRGENEPAVLEELERVEKEIARRVGPHIFARGNERMEAVVGRLLAENNQTFSVAESCTGGLIGHLVTNVPGSSRYFQGGVMVYSNPSKQDLLHVQPKTLEAHGAVSDPTVRQMAVGVREHLKSDLGLAVTGIAGPDGGTRNKPVGTVYVGLATEKDVFSKKYRFWGTRRQIKSNTAMMALDWVRRYLCGDPFLPGI
jgi:nicotinamide-nucleotide amidase